MKNWARRTAASVRTLAPRSKSLLALIGLALIAACGGGGGGTSGGSSPTAPVLNPPSISAQPTGQSVTAGSAAEFKVTASGDAIGYQWQSSSDGGSTWADVPGASGPTLVLSAVVIGDNGRRFRVVVGNSAGSVTSAVALLSVTNPATQAASLVSGDSHSCLIRTDNTVVCWGLNWLGELGDGTATNRTRPVAVAGLSGVAAISAGGDHTCAARTDGSVACWGYNNYGQLGVDATVTTLSKTPIDVPRVSGVVAVSGGSDFTCALKSDKTVVCWGDNSEGTIGAGTFTHSMAPTAVIGLSDAVALATGYDHACALSVTGTVACWGHNSDGELGDNQAERGSATPVPVPGLSNVIAIAAKWHSTCATKSDKSVVCWGANGYGQLGNGTMTFAGSVPTAIPGMGGVAALTSGTYHACAALLDDTTRCWGRNESGQLGDSTTTNSSSPVTVLGLSGAVKLSGGMDFSCAATNSSVMCWGANALGQLGDGSTTSRPAPTPVLF